MKKLYEKNKLTFAIVWIVIYCVLQSLANPLNAAFVHKANYIILAVYKSRGSCSTAPVNIISQNSM